MNKDFFQQLKKINSTLWEINKFIIDAKKLGYGEILLTIKTHDYISKMVDLKAVKPKKKTMAKSVTKRVMIRKSDI